MSLNIKTADGYQSLASLGGNVINGAEMQHYSEEERVIGYWIDGKPLYRRIISGTSPNSNTTVAIPLDIPNAENAHLVYGYITNIGNNYKFPLNYWRTSSDSAFFVVADDGTSIVLGIAGAGLYNSKYYAEIRYTKTTDTPIANNNTYSTDEVLTGKTWIDGKPIYRKVFTGVDVHLTYNTWCDTNKFLYNVDTLIDGMFIDSDTHYLGNYMGFNINLDRIRVLSSRSSTLDFTGATIILEYTKTTD